MRKKERIKVGMGKGRAPCCEKHGLRKGSWTPAEDTRLMTYILRHGHGNWRVLPKQAGLLRCGKSCRLRWINYLRPDIKRGNFSKEEEDTIIRLHQLLGNKWSNIASRLPGRTDNEIKNVWNTHLKKRLVSAKEPLLSTSPSPSSNSSSYSASLSILRNNHIDNCSFDRSVNTNASDGSDMIVISSATCNPSHNESNIIIDDHINDLEMEGHISDDGMNIFETPAKIMANDVDIWTMLDDQVHDYNHCRSSTPNPTNCNMTEIEDDQFNTKFAPEQQPQVTADPMSSPSITSNINSNDVITQSIATDHHQLLDDGNILLFRKELSPLITTTMTTNTLDVSQLMEDNAWIQYLERELDLLASNEESNNQSPLMEDLSQQPPMVPQPQPQPQPQAPHLFHEDDDLTFDHVTGYMSSESFWVTPSFLSD